MDLCYQTQECNWCTSSCGSSQARPRLGCMREDLPVRLPEKITVAEQSPLPNLAQTRQPFSTTELDGHVTYPICLIGMG